jgi:hypothetical protein
MARAGWLGRAGWHGQPGTLGATRGNRTRVLVVSKQALEVKAGTKMRRRRAKWSLRVVSGIPFTRLGAVALTMAFFAAVPAFSWGACIRCPGLGAISRQVVKLFAKGGRVLDGLLNDHLQ